MKTLIQKLLMLSLLAFLSIQLACAQKADSAARSTSDALYHLYVKRHKTFNTLGWVCVAPGVTMMAVGLTELGSGDIFSSSFSGGATLFAVGGIMALGSIPCFILAGSNEKKALLQLSTGRITGVTHSEYVGLSLKIDL